jgi:pyruvate,orthophosphate dikinase
MTADRYRWIRLIDGSDLPDRSLIGGKAWSIAHIRALDLAVPPAFVITTEACREFLHTGNLPPDLGDELAAGVAWLQSMTGRYFGGPAPAEESGAAPKVAESPLLLSIRSGAPVSMPGMMDTILNLGIDARTETALALESGDEGFARDTHRRFLELYAGIVMKTVGLELDGAAPPGDWYRAIEQQCGAPVPGDPVEQLEEAVRAVFASWNSRRAKRYRKHHDIPDDLGTAVTVQAMVFGNLDDHSGTGVLFSRNPLTGETAPYGEYLARAQGEDVVSGKFQPQPLATLKDLLPEVHQQLLAAATTLENANRDAQDIEFTVQKGELFLLQTRTAKRAPEAAVRMAVEMVKEGVISPDEALARVTPDQVRVMLRPSLQPGAADGLTPLATGEGACQGVGAGTIVTDTDEAETRAQAGEAIVLARPITSPEDVHGMIPAQAIITEKGGSTSHAAVVSRALGLPCVVGCGEGSVVRLAGQEVTVCGETGKVYQGLLPVTAPAERDNALLVQLIDWARERCPAGRQPEPGVDPVLPELLATLHAGHPDDDQETLAAQAGE